MKSASFSIDPQSAIGSFSFKGWTNHIQDHQIFFCSIYVKKYEDLQFPGKFKGGYNRWVTTWMSVGDTGRIETEPIVVGVSDWETDNRKKRKTNPPSAKKTSMRWDLAVRISFSFFSFHVIKECVVAIHCGSNWRPYSRLYHSLNTISLLRLKSPFVGS